MNEDAIKKHISEKVIDSDLRAKTGIKTDKERHALNRWNERVGPKLTKQELDEWVQLYYRMGEIRFLTDVFGYLSDEIVFAYKMEKEKVIITTFYGRVSQKPILRDILALREYNRVYNDYVDLKLDKDVLAEQKLPSKANAVFLHMKKNRTIYIEKYVTDTGKDLLFYWERNKGFQEVKLEQPELGSHDSVVLSFLKNNGYATYVTQYQKIHKRK